MALNKNGRPEESPIASTTSTAKDKATPPFDVKEFSEKLAHEAVAALNAKAQETREARSREAAKPLWETNPPPRREEFQTQEEFEEALGFWNSRIGRLRGMAGVKKSAPSEGQ
jgi:hypothetical protein